MNDIAKTSIKDRLISALSKENLSKTKAGELLGVKPQYLSMVLSPSQWNKFPEATWDILQKWVNSGQGLQEYSEKHGRVLPEAITPKPIKASEVAKDEIDTLPKNLSNYKPEKPVNGKVEPESKTKPAKGQLIDMLIEEKELLKAKVDAIDLLLRHYIS